MANYDAGHYFLTIMAPLDRNGYVEVDGDRRSLIDHVRHMLITLPTAQQDSNSTDSGLNSPFARVPGTHFAHFFIIDDLRYNGRRKSHPILDLIFNVKLTIAEKVDHLPHAYLVLALDFDAMDGSDASLRAYTDDLWRHMSGELTMIFENCIGFERVTSEEGFFRFVREAQVDTTLPFNDYWAYDPPRISPVPYMATGSVGIVALAATAYWSMAWTGGFWGLFALTLLALLVLNIGLIVKFGTTPFPTAPDSDLGSVLKALYVQQMFVGFAIDNLGSSDQDLYDAFDAFCETHKPGNVEAPRQAPGVLRSVWTSS